MRKIKYTVSVILLLALIVGASLLPNILSIIHDEATHGTSHYSALDTIQIDMSNDRTKLTVFDSLLLLTTEDGSPVDGSQASLSEDDILSIIIPKLALYEDAALIEGAIQDLSLLAYDPYLFYSKETGLYNIIWNVVLAGNNPNQRFAVALDDATGSILMLGYECEADDSEADAVAKQEKLEQFAALYFGDLGLEYTINGSASISAETSVLTSTCTDSAGRTIIIEFTLSKSGFSNTYIS